MFFILLAIGWMAVSLFWRISIPFTFAPLLATETNSLRVAETLKDVKWFGTAGDSTAGQNLVSPKLILKGLIGARGPRAAGMAIFLLDGNVQKVVKEGDEIFPGYVLDKVKADGVQIERNGTREFLPLPKRSG